MGKMPTAHTIGLPVQITDFVLKNAQKHQFCHFTLFPDLPSSRYFACWINNLNYEKFILISQKTKYLQPII